MIKLLENKRYDHLRVFTLNFGPQHPAAHGVLRLILAMKGELILHADSHLGLLHRGTEKLMEFKNSYQGSPYLDRLDYVSMMAYEHTFILLIEKLLGIKLPGTLSYFRIIFLELTRILNHILAISCQAMDLGAVTPYFWGFEEREKICEFYERVSGARMHATFFRVGGFSKIKIFKELLEDISIYCSQLSLRIREFDDLLTYNRIWKERLVNVGIITAKEAIKYGLSGVMLRGSGIKWDLRKNMPYEYYTSLDFQIPLGKNGDCYDRYLVRLEEIKQSLYIIEQCIAFYKFSEFQVLNNTLSSDEGLVCNSKIFLDEQELKSSMEKMITHYKNSTEYFNIPTQEIYIGTEAPKGEFGIFLVTNNTSKPYRIKFKAPGFANLQILNKILEGSFLADVVTIIGSLDIVFGEVDR